MKISQGTPTSGAAGRPNPFSSPHQQLGKGLPAVPQKGASKPPDSAKYLKPKPLGKPPSDDEDLRRKTAVLLGLPPTADWNEIHKVYTDQSAELRHETTKKFSAKAF